MFHCVSTFTLRSKVREGRAKLQFMNSTLHCPGVSPNSVIVNGVVLDNLEGIEESLLNTLQNQLPKLQRAVYMGEV